MTGGRGIVWGVVGVLAVAGSAAAARLQVTASRADLLYAPGQGSSQEPDCNTLSALADGQLPFYVVRLTAQLPPGVPADQAVFTWRLPKPNVGVLAADQDLGPTGETSLVRTLCTQVGNACALTEEQVAVYSRPTILWLAPTCDILPDDTSKAYKGGRVTFGVSAKVGKRRLGKGSVKVGFGRIGKITLLVSAPSENRFRDGIGNPNPERVPLNPIFGATIQPPSGVDFGTVVFDSDGGGILDVPPGQCGVAGLDACTAPGQVLYTESGKHVALVSAQTADGSVLCDKLAVNVATVPLDFKVEVSTTPAGHSFAAGQFVNLRVRVRNTSPPSNLPNLLFVGNVLTCKTTVKSGGSTLEKEVQIDLQHCSSTVTQPCTTDAECAAGPCESCVAGEVCLTSSHCQNSTQGCVSDRDCQPPRCTSSRCGPGVTCVQVVPLSQIFLGRNDVFDIINNQVPVDNLLPKKAAVTDKWTAHSFNAGDATDTLKYSIRPRP